jgi:hypothetical protein
MHPASEQLSRLLVDAYRPYVLGRLDELGLPRPGGLEPALEAGVAWVSAQLRDLLDRPFPSQPRGPLEVFQEAMRFATDALTEAGVDPVGRDEVTQRALPGDRYHLAPASSAALGEEVWRAHLEWGAVKAASVVRSL